VRGEVLGARRAKLAVGSWQLAVGSKKSICFSLSGDCRLSTDHSDRRRSIPPAEACIKVPDAAGGRPLALGAVSRLAPNTSPLTNRFSSLRPPRLCVLCVAFQSARTVGLRCADPTYGSRDPLILSSSLWEKGRFVERWRSSLTSSARLRRRQWSGALSKRIRAPRPSRIDFLLCALRVSVSSALPSRAPE